MTLRALDPQFPYRPFILAFLFLKKFFRHLLASSLLRGCAYLGNDLSSWEETCFAMEWQFGRRINHDSRVLCLQDTYEFPHQRRFGSQKDTEALWSRKNDRSTQTTSRLVKHLINTSLGADNWPKAVRVKDVPLGHPPLALAALSISNVALVGSWSYRTLSALHKIGV
jgi:hypothetical protein